MKECIWHKICALYFFTTLFKTFLALMNIIKLCSRCMQKHIGIYVNHLLLLSDFNQNWNALTNFSENLQ
jgi:hypothetical protein